LYFTYERRYVNSGLFWTDYGGRINILENGEVWGTVFLYWKMARYSGTMFLYWKGRGIEGSL